MQNKGMKMDGLYPAVFINLGYFQLKCCKVFLGLYSPATYAHRRPNKMHIERAFRIINLLDVPEKKRKFWPQHSIIILDKVGNILDVVQYFEGSATDISFANMRYYPGSLSFATEVDWYPTIEEFTKRIKECFEPNTEDTYIVGKGLVKNMSPDDKKKYLPNKETKDKLSFLRKFRRWWRANG